MIELKEFKPRYTAKEENNNSYKNIKFENKISATSSNYDIDRLISYRNRKGVKFTRI